ncbi:hypothetical protein EG856_02160 [Mycoplasmopsis phocirhinis]|uniref:Uncharacterized protein n=1 Tax=Mycoplasmopsis phocirhinis TaxID=142650 RepID=A0A4P6MS88_9BACT|nr:hypothetical protein [Mycoplasmopsis phocirhinis]QBF34711.1 hypothetical protein EG856_02160 [Mycoplasmopsis phocirhinis]
MKESMQKKKKKKLILALSTSAAVLSLTSIVVFRTYYKLNKTNKKPNNTIQDNEKNNDTGNKQTQNNLPTNTDKKPSQNEQTPIQSNEYINQLRLLKFKNDISQKIIENETKKPTNNKTEQEQFLNLIKSFDDQLSQLLKFNEYYQLDSQVQNQIQNLNNIEISRQNITNIKNDINQLILNSKEFILQNNIQTNNVDFKQSKDDLFNTINNSNQLTNEQKNELSENLKNDLLDDDLVLTQMKFLELENKNRNFEQNLANSSIAGSIKNDIQLILNINKNNDNYSYKIEVEKLLSSIEQLKTKLKNIDNELNSQNTNNLKKFDLYTLKSEYRDVFDTNLNKLHILDFSNTIAKINEFSNKIDEINAKTYEKTDKSLEQILLEHTQNLFILEEHRGAKKYDFDQYQSSGSFNLKNAKLFFDYQDNKIFDFEIINLELNGQNLETLQASIEVKIKGFDTPKAIFKKQKTFQRGAKNDLDSITINNLDDLYDINYELINSYTEQEWQNLSQEQKNKILTPKKAKIGKYFSQTFTNLKIQNTKVSADIDIYFGKQKLKTLSSMSANNISWRNLTTYPTQEDYWDKINLDKTLNIIRGDKNQALQELFKNTTIKDLNNYTTHSDILASDAQAKLGEIYNLPKFGNYEIYIEFSEPNGDNSVYGDTKISRSASGGSRLIYLWYKKNGVKAPKVQNRSRTINSFAYLNYEDIKPKQKHFSAEDFIPIRNSVVEESFKQQIDRINESNFHISFSEGKVNTRQNVVEYRNLNVKSFIEQEAFNKFNYFIKIKDGRDAKGINHDNETFLSTKYKNHLYDKDIVVNTDMQASLLENYFYYFYDFEQVSKRSISFKVGWINRFDNNKRYTNGQKYTLINIVNDYEQALYPDIMLNNINLNDLTINFNSLSLNTANYFVNHPDELNQLITLNANEQNNIVYNNFELPAQNFKISEVIPYGNDSAYIKFSVEGYDPIGDKTKIIQSHAYLKINGFKADSSVNETENIDDMLLDNSNLSVIFKSSKEVKRRRVIEPYWRDLMWQYDKSKDYAFWVLDKKYLQKTFFANDALKRKLIFDIHANALINDPDKNKRVRQQSLQFELDFENLITNKVISFEQTSPTFDNNSSFKYNVIFQYLEDQGIKIIITTQDNNFKVIIDEPETQRFTNNQIFDQQKALIILPAAVKTTIEYTNEVQNENFNINSNKFDYNDVFYNRYDQPILFSNDTEFLKNKDIYYPNQNVPYKLHDGYKMNVDTLRWLKQKDWDLAKNTWLRALYYTALDRKEAGSTSIIGKVNQDPNDHKYYVLTNRHVDGETKFKKWDQLVGDNFLTDKDQRRLAFSAKNIYSDVNRAARPFLPHINNINGVRYNPVGTTIWSGIEQISENEGITPKEEDLNIFIVDLNNDYQNSIQSGAFNRVWKYENLKKLPNAKFNIGSKQSIISVPYTREVASVGWPNGKIAGHINRRPKIENGEIIQLHTQENYSQVFAGRIGSGTGMYVDDDTYIATWKEGFNGRASQGPRYVNRNYNYFGVNFDGQHPFDIKNTHSFAAQIIRANLTNPNQYDLPWFFEAIKDQNE